MSPVLDALVLALALSDVGLAMFVFTAIARPEKLVGLAAALAGERDAFDQGMLTESDLVRLATAVRRSGPVLLLLLFGWSFLCGAVLEWSRL